MTLSTHTKKHLWLQTLLALLLSISLLTGCAAPAAPAPSEASSQAEAAASAYEQYDEDTLKVQSDFDAFTDQLFCSEVAQSPITLHYTLADPSSYGITDYPRDLGTVSVEDIKKDLTDVRELYSRLTALDSRKLREDQLLTYTILSSYLNPAYLWRDWNSMTSRSLLLWAYNPSFPFSYLNTSFIPVRM